MIQFRINPEIILLLLIVWIGYPCLAQKEIPQNPNRYETDKSKKGNWTVLYNEDGIETNDPSSTSYYRLISYKKGIIEGQVVEHYKSGVKKWEGYLTSDDPDSLTGINKWYDTDGNLICILHFDNDKLQLSISEALHPNRSNKNLTFKNSLEFYADLLAKKKRYNEAISIYQILISAIQKTGAKPIDMARIFQSTGSSWLFIDEYINALTNFQLASQVTDREEDLVPAYLKSGECLIKLGQSDSAHFYLNKSIELQKSFKTTETDTYAQTLDQSGLAYYNLKDYNPAINNFKKALGILKSGQKQISEEYIIMLHHAALAYSESGSSAAAVKAQKLGVTIAGKVYEKGSAEIAYVQMQMAKIYLNCSQPGMAVKEALPALRVLKRNKDSHTKLYVGGLIITGEIYENLKQEKLVEYYYNLALKTIDEYRGSYNIDYTQLLARLADLQFDSGRFDVSRENYLSLKLLWSTLMGSTYKNLGSCFFNLGIISLSQGDQTGAKSQFEEAANIYLYHQPGFNHELGDTYEKLAEINYRIEDLDEAVSYAQKCIDVRNLSGNISLSNVYSILGNIKLRQGKWDEARSNFENALARSMDQHGTGHISTFQANYDLAKLYDQTGDQGKALRHLSNAGRIFRLKLIPVFHFLQENAKIQIYLKLEEFTNYYIEYHTRQSNLSQTTLGELGSFITVSKYFVLNPYSRIENMVHVTGKNEIEIAYEEWRETKIYAAKVLYDINKLQRSRSLSDSLDNINIGREEIMMYGSEAIKSVLESRLISTELLFESLKPDEQVIESFRYRQGDENVIYGFVHYKKEPNARIQLIINKNGWEMENENFERFFNNIKAEETEIDSYEKYFKPIEELFKGTGVVYFSPSGIYNKINLSSLRHPDEKYIYEKHDIRYITGLDQIPSMGISATTQKQVVLVGDPNFNFSIDSLTQVSVPKLKDIRYLPVKGSSFEVTLIGNLLDEKEWYHVDYFQENALEKYISDSYNPAILHVSTHGFFYNQEFSGYYHNPALKSGLLLTSGNYTIPEMNEMSSKHVLNSEDGFLSNYEIVGLNMERTYTVFLSLSGSDYQSSNNSVGYGSLMNAFSTAGVHYQIMSLWEQDANTKDEFIRQFYKEWLVNKDVRFSFNAAIEKIRNNAAHPYYWGGLILVGK